jgi:hypothetical protein
MTRLLLSTDVSRSSSGSSFLLDLSAECFFFGDAGRCFSGDLERDREAADEPESLRVTTDISV